MGRRHPGQRLGLLDHPVESTSITAFSSLRSHTERNEQRGLANLMDREPEWRTKQTSGGPRRPTSSFVRGTTGVVLGFWIRSETEGLHDSSGMGRLAWNGRALMLVRWSKRGASEASASIEDRDCGSHPSPEAGRQLESVQAAREVDLIDGLSTGWVSGPFAADRRTLCR